MAMRLKIEIEVDSSGQQEDDYGLARALAKDLIELVDAEKKAKLIKYEIVR